MAPALAQRTLTVGASSAPTGMDPHYHSSNMNNAQLRQVFGHALRKALADHPQEFDRLKLLAATEAPMLDRARTILRDLG